MSTSVFSWSVFSVRFGFLSLCLKVEYLTKLFTEMEVVSEGHLPLATPTLVIWFFFSDIYIYIYIYIYLNSDII